VVKTLGKKLGKFVSLNEKEKLKYRIEKNVYGHRRGKQDGGAGQGSFHVTVSGPTI